MVETCWRLAIDHKMILDEIQVFDWREPMHELGSPENIDFCLLFVVGYPSKDDRNP